MSGLTADQIGRLFGVSRRSVQNWIAGAVMAAQHEERLSLLLAVVADAGSSPDERRASILSSSHGMSVFHQLVAQVKKDAMLQTGSVTARDRLGV